MRFSERMQQDSALVSLLHDFRRTGGEAPVISSSYLIIPGLADVHVHLREPGYFYKETIRTGTLAGARSGYTALCAMPNLDPVPDSAAHLACETDIIRRDAVIPVYPYGAITVGEKGAQIADMETMAPDACAFSDDGHGVEDAGLMREAMYRARALGKVIAAHCEDKSLVAGGYIHDGVYARTHGHRGIPSESEWRQIERDLRLAADTGVQYHVCHVSAKESVALIREAKKSGVNVTCETAPHYLLLTDGDLREDGSFRMNPPLRSEEDRQALLEGVADGTVDMIATDHAPHSREEKSRGLAGSLFGITGLEVAFPVLWTGLVRTGILSPERLVQLMSTAPRVRFGLPGAGDYAVYEIATPYRIDPEKFVSMGKSTPFSGCEVYGSCKMTVQGGKIVWEETTTEN